MPATYLTGRSLTKQIRKVMAGTEPRMCVAFLGPNWQREVFGDTIPENLKIICDVGMGLTSRGALSAGGAPHNNRLRHLPENEMHAKIYLSEIGGIVCSANASARALSSAKRIEDGVWVGPDSEAYAQLKKTFTKRYKESAAIDASTLASAPEYVNDGVKKTGDPVGLTLTELVRHDPNVFCGMRFIFTSTTTPKKIRDAADDRLLEEDDDEISSEGRPRRDYFSGWDVSERQWPALFISIHRSKNGKFYLYKNRHHRFLPGVAGNSDGSPQDVFVANIVDWDITGAAFGDIPKLASHAQCIEELKVIYPSAASFKKYAGNIMKGEKFAALLLKDSKRD